MLFDFVIFRVFVILSLATFQAIKNSFCYDPRFCYDFVIVFVIDFSLIP